ncbi:hypothetical protein MTO96_014273 [Rhipicephalus appendiculatus]
MTNRELENYVSGLLRQPLCPENYVDKLQLLLHLEEVQLSRDLEERVLCPAPLRIDGCEARLNLSSWLEEGQFPPGSVIECCCSQRMTPTPSSISRASCTRSCLMRPF